MAKSNITSKIYIGDAASVMKRYIPDGCIDATITSPPYDDLRDYNGYTIDFKSIIQELYRITADGGVCVWVVNDKTKNGSETGSSFKQALMFIEAGWKLYDTMIYAKNNAIPLTHPRYEQVFEYMFVFSKGKPKTFNPIMIDCLTDSKPGNFRQRSDGVLEAAHKKDGNNKQKIKGNIWYYSVGSNKSSKDKIAFKHPATFPEALVYDHLVSWTNEGEIVFDPFLGSGTTAKVAALNGRRFVGVDISEEYIKDVCSPRLDEYNIEHEIIMLTS